MMKKFVSYLFFCVLLTVGSSSAVLAEDTDIRSVIESLNSTWNNAFNSGDASAVAALYAENATISPGNGQILVGRAEIEKLFKTFIDNGVHNHIIEIIKAHRDGNYAYEVAKWSANGPMKDGKKPTFGGILVNVFHRGDDGNWRSQTHIWNASN
jgi:uncharacterized protein (TIGR02246 family)